MPVFTHVLLSFKSYIGLGLSSNRLSAGAVGSQQRRPSGLSRNPVSAKVDCRRNPPASAGRRSSGTGHESGTPLALRGMGEHDQELVEQLRRDIIDTCALCHCAISGPSSGF